MYIYIYLSVCVCVKAVPELRPPSNCAPAKGLREVVTESTQRFGFWGPASQKHFVAQWVTSSLLSLGADDLTIRL